MKGIIMEEKYINIGEIDVEKFKNISAKIVTYEVIITLERYNHIIERYKQNFELYFKEL